MKLTLEEVKESGKSLFATLQVDHPPYSVGRDLTCDLPISNNALSRKHGVFFGFNSGWVFRDLESTNGSWINGDKLVGGRLTVIRDSDFLQIADVVLKVQYHPEMDQKPLPLGYRLFVIRNEKDTVELDPANFEGVIVTEFGVSFELKPDGFFLEFDSPEIIVDLNGQPVSETRALMSNDCIRIGDVEMIVVEGVLSTGFSSRVGVKKNIVHVPEKVRVNLDLTAIDPGLTEAAPYAEQATASVFSPARTTMIDPARAGRARFGEALVHDASGGEEGGDASFGRFNKDSRADQSSWIDLDNLNEYEKRVLIGIIFFAIASFALLIVWFFAVR